MISNEFMPGNPYPQGANWDGAGVNFALFSENAESVDLCLFEDAGSDRETTRIAITEKTDDVWHIYIPGVKAGLRYGYRVRGAYDPARGYRFNPSKLLIDPYAKAIDGAMKWDDALFGYTVGHPDGDLSRDDRDSAPFVPKSVVIDPFFDWRNDTQLRTPWHETIIYELHVKGYQTAQRHPRSVARHLCGDRTPVVHRSSYFAWCHRGGTDAGASSDL